MEKLKKLFKFVLVKLILKLRRFESSETIIIFSEARGGSTWLMEIIREIVPVCINWEPLHVQNGVVSKSEKFGWRPFIPQTEASSKYRLLFQKIHEYRVSTKWTVKYLSVADTIKSKYVLTKYVRANLLVPYLVQQFDFKHKPIFLIRHPIDTCLSQIRAFHKGKTRTKPEIPDCINNERYIEHAEFLASLETDLELKIAEWCINNCLTINKLDASTTCVTFYSDLLLDPEQEVIRILASIGLEEYTSNLDAVNFRKPSSTDFRNDLSESIEIQLNKKIETLDISVKHRIQMIFDYFDFTLYSAYTSKPDKNQFSV